MNHASRYLVLPLLLIAACGSSEAPDISATDLRSAAGEGGVSAFYEANDWQAVWSDDAENTLRRALGERAAHGLDRVDFLFAGENSPAAREAALTRAALTYASALSRGVVDPNDLYGIYTIPRPDPDLAGGLAGALSSGRVEEWLAGLAPVDAEYRALSDAYQRLRAEAEADDAAPIPGGELIREGETDPRVPQIAAALRRHGFLQRSADRPAQETGSPDSENLFTAEMAEALSRFQEERRIAADGVVGPNTLQALNRGPADYVRSAAVALERRRWLTRNPPETRIDVNTGASMLSYFRDGTLIDRRKVVVGQPGWKTPQLQSQFFRLVANPTWTVPKSIEADEMAGVGPAYLRRNNMVRRDGWIVQLPGPGNALGLVKFDLDNQYAIYLHDTPAKSLFEKNQRHLSHGCIRVEDALGFARMIANDQGISGQWQEARASSGEDLFLRLPEPFPVRLLYNPTWLDLASGEVQFAPDVYGWNGPIGEQLGFGESRGRRSVRHVPDIGP